MYLFEIFRSFLPLRNTIGFGVADFLLLSMALLLGALTFLRPWIETLGARLARRTLWCMAALALLPVALRLLLLWHHPVPFPDVYDEFGHLLEADTLRHFRFANPMHPMREFFETYFALQEPSYSSIYPMGQGAALAIGWTLFGHPWAGVLLSLAAFCGLCFWMLRGWTTPGWALAGGCVAVCEFGPLSRWTNSYWGGFVPAIAGCLIFGALPRLRAGGRRRDAILLGLGLSLHLLSRPYETVFLAVAVALYFALALRKPAEWRALARIAPAVALAVAPALGITLLQNKQVTGSWTTLPEMAYQYQYGLPGTFTFQAPAEPHHALTPQQAMAYKMELSFRNGPESLPAFLERLEYRVRYYRFFFYAPLYLALPFFLMRLREPRLLWVALAALLLALGINFFPSFQLHYVAGATCLFVLMSVAGLEGMSRLTVRGAPVGAQCAALLLMLCGAQFLFWYGMHVFDAGGVSATAQSFETWDSINHANPERRLFVKRELDRVPGKLLVFVRYYPQHVFQDEWVYNAADIDGARVVWARDLGAEKDQELLRYYPERTPLLLEPDFRPPRLSPYAASPFER
ncbi:MAG TPA: hypothetical protein VMU19_10445 [Bryobacteraceae bacterium]|nr:hypothetical protein [Bryobacteraceae bacterium]